LENVSLPPPPKTFLIVPELVSVSVPSPRDKLLSIVPELMIVSSPLPEITSLPMIVPELMSLFVPA
jgi:hypothetical protein